MAKTKKAQHDECPPGNGNGNGDPGSSDFDLDVSLETLPWGTIHEVYFNPAPSATPQPGKLSLWVNDVGVNGGKIQTIIGSLQAIKRYTLNNVVRKGRSGDVAVWGYWNSATSGNILIDNVNLGSVGFAIGAGFPIGNTMAFNAGADVLIARLLEYGK